MYHLPTRGWERRATWCVMAADIARRQTRTTRRHSLSVDKAGSDNRDQYPGGRARFSVAHRSGDSFGKASASWCRSRCTCHSELFIQLAVCGYVRSEFADETRRPPPQGDFSANVGGLSMLSRRYIEQFIVRSHQELCSHGDVYPASYDTGQRPRGGCTLGCSNAFMRRTVANDANPVLTAAPQRRVAKKSRSSRAASSSPIPG